MNSPTSERLEKFLGYLSLDPENQSLLCDCLDMAGSLNQPLANELAQRLLNLPSRTLASDAFLSDWYMKNQEWPLAADLLQGLAETQANPVVVYNLALCLAYSGKYPEAFAVLEPVFEQPPVDLISSAYVLFAQCALHIGSREVAKGTLHRLLEMKPADDEALGLLALIHSDENNRALAEQYKLAALSHNPNNCDANLIVGEGFISNQNFSQASATFESILLHKRSSRALKGIAIIALSEGRSSQAEAALLEVLGNNAKQIDALQLLGIAQALQDKISQAIASLKQVEQLEPDDITNKYLLAFVYMLAQQQADADAIIQSLEAKDSPLKLFTLSLRQAIKGDKANAKKLLASALQGKLEDGRTYLDAIKRF